MKAITIMAALVATVIVLSGCGPRDEKAQEAETPQATTEAPAQTKEFTDDDFIEYWEQTVYLAAKHQANPIKYGEELGKLHEKYPGIDEKFPAWMAEWSQKAMNDPEKAKQWEEIMKRVEARAEGLLK